MNALLTLALSLACQANEPPEKQTLKKGEFAVVRKDDGPYKAVAIQAANDVMTFFKLFEESDVSREKRFADFQTKGLAYTLSPDVHMKILEVNDKYLDKYEWNYVEVLVLEGLLISRNLYVHSSSIEKVETEGNLVPRLIAEHDDQVRPGDILKVAYIPWGTPIRAPVSSGLYYFHQMHKYIEADDEKGLKDLEEKGYYFRVESGVNVRILEVSKINQDDLNWRFFVVRILDGEHKDKEVHIAKGHVGKIRVVFEKGAIPAKSRAKPKPISNVARAATLLKSAESLEKAGKPAAALSLYKGIVKDFPGTAQARAAGVRAGAIGK